MTVSDQEKKLLMNFLIEYLKLEAWEIDWQKLQDPFFELIKDLVAADTVEVQLSIIKNISKYINDFASDTIWSYKQLQHAKMHFEAELEHDQDITQADNLINTVQD